MTPTADILIIFESFTSVCKKRYSEVASCNLKFTCKEVSNFKKRKINPTQHWAHGIPFVLLFFRHSRGGCNNSDHADGEGKKSHLVKTVCSHLDSSRQQFLLQKKILADELAELFLVFKQEGRFSNT